MKNVEILKGQGSGRETAIRAIEGGVWNNCNSRYTSVPHNGCRPQNVAAFRISISNKLKYG
jgi:ribosomal protein S11